MTSHLPEAPHRRRKPQRPFGAPLGDAPVECRSEVVEVELQAVELSFALVTEQPALCSFRQRDEGGGVAVPDEIHLSALLEAVAGELADRLQHDQPRLVEIRHAPQETLVRQLVKATEHIGAGFIGRAANRLGLLEAGAASKHGEPGHQPLQSRIEQLVAPGDRAGEGLLATRQVAGTASQGVEAFLQPGVKRLRREQLDPRGC